MNTTYDVAILIDGDNAPRQLDDLFWLAQNYGENILCHVFVNQESKSSWFKFEDRFTFELILTHPGIVVDYILMFRAAELYREFKIKTFLIVTSDGDLSPIVIYLRAEKVFTLIVGSENSSDALRKLKNFITHKGIVDLRAGTINPYLMDIAQIAYRVSTPKKGWVRLNIFENTLRAVDDAFRLKDYGYHSLRDLLQSLTNFETKVDKKGVSIRQLYDTYFRDYDGNSLLNRIEKAYCISAKKMGWVNLADLEAKLLIVDKDFDVEDYGCSDLLSLLQSLPDFETEASAKMAFVRRFDETTMLDHDHNYLATIVEKAYRASPRSGRWVNLSYLGSELKKIDKSFTSQDYGHLKLLYLMQSLPSFETVSNSEGAFTQHIDEADSPNGDNYLLSIVQKAYHLSNPKDGWVNLATFGHKLRFVDNDFTTKTYGYPTLRKLLQSLPNFETKSGPKGAFARQMDDPTFP